MRGAVRLAKVEVGRDTLQGLTGRDTFLYRVERPVSSLVDRPKVEMKNIPTHWVRGPVACTRPVSAEHNARAETRAVVEMDNMIE